MPAPVASGWSGRRAGLAPAGKAPPCHGARGKPPFGPESSLKSRLAFTQRRAASVPGFGYSKATRKAGAAGLVWGEATLDKFLENPSVFCRAPALGYAGLKSTQKRAHLIAFLRAAGGESQRL